MKLVRTITIGLFLTSSPSLWAQKVNFDFGMFSINAEPPQAAGSGTARANVSLSGPGAYSISGSLPIRPSLEVGVGYTIFYSQLISGDMGFGPDLNLIYFPMNEGSGLKFQSFDLRYTEIQKWRPFLQAAFHQRQFQSVDSAYSGFGFGGGVETMWTDDKSWRVTLRSMSLLGPSQSTFNYFDLMFGIQLHFK